MLPVPLHAALAERIPTGNLLVGDAVRDVGADGTYTRTAADGAGTGHGVAVRYHNTGPAKTRYPGHDPVRARLRRPR